jgi:two-component system KDP operon response regulator KdpE
MKHLLVVDDDNVFRDTLVKALKNQGYRAMGISDPDTLASTIAIHQPDVVLLDMMYDNGSDGLEICRKLRLWSSIPVVILSVLEDEMTKVAVLDAGADDYLSKPFGINELLARLRAVERRLTGRNIVNANVVAIGDLVIDFEDWQVKLQDKQIRLTRKEFVLLRTLADAQGRLVKYERLLAEIWPEEHTVERSKVRALVMQLRHKLQEDLSQPRYILTEAGVGYRLNLDRMEPSHR